jgi:hypothetical protein
VIQKSPVQVTKLYELVIILVQFISSSGNTNFHQYQLQVISSETTHFIRILFAIVAALENSILKKLKNSIQIIKIIFFFIDRYLNINYYFQKKNYIEY